MINLKRIKDELREFKIGCVIFDEIWYNVPDKKLTDIVRCSGIDEEGCKACIGKFYVEGRSKGMCPVTCNGQMVFKIVKLPEDFITEEEFKL